MRTPLRLFKSFFDDTLVDTTVGYTKLYSHREKVDTNFEITNGTFRIFLGMLMLSRYCNDVTEHYQVPSEKQDRWKVYKKNSSRRCVKCKVNLHDVCLKNFMDISKCFTVQLKVQKQRPATLIKNFAIFTGKQYYQENTCIRVSF